MTTARSFGLVLLLTSAALLAFISTGALLQAPLLLLFGTLGGLAAAALGVRVILGGI